MQLFLTPCSVQGSKLVIENPLVLEQLRKVLRAKKGDTIAVQDTHRYVVTIDDRDNTKVYTTIAETIVMPTDLGPMITMYIALPNKWDKAELIAQKATELGVSRLIFWRAERSVLREVNDNKVLRIQKIMQEAVEQSRGWQLPVLSFVVGSDWTIDDPVIIFDKNVAQNQSASSGKYIGVIGPEGGLTSQDYSHFPDHIVYSLGNTILRMETAAIVGTYVLKNH